MVSLTDRLNMAEDEFLSALTEGGDAIVAFDKRWEALLADINETIDSTGLDPDTSTLAHAVSLRIALLADTSVEVYSSCDTYTSQLMDQMNALVSELSLTNIPSPAPLTHPSSRSRTPPSYCERSQHNGSLKRRRATDQRPGEGGCKRRRFASHEDILPADSPSPLSTTPPQSIQHQSRYCSQVLSNDLPRQRKRKRSASDADVAGTPSYKRLYVGPRLHAVSDSFRTPITSGHETSSIVDAQAAIQSQSVVTSFDPSLPVDIQPLANLLDTISTSPVMQPPHIDLPVNLNVGSSGSDFFDVSVVEYDQLPSSSHSSPLTLLPPLTPAFFDANGAAANHPLPPFSCASLCTTIGSPVSAQTPAASNSPLTPQMFSISDPSPLYEAEWLDQCDSTSWPWVVFPADTKLPKAEHTADAHHESPPPSCFDNISPDSLSIDWVSLFDSSGSLAWLSEPPPYRSPSISPLASDSEDDGLSPGHVETNGSQFKNL